MAKEKVLLVALVVAIVFGIASFASAIYFKGDRDSLTDQLKELSEQTPEAVVVPSETLNRPAPSNDQSEDIDKLNAYIERLEAELAGYKQQLAANNGNGGRGGRGGWGEGGERRQPMSMEELKEKDPVRYEEIQQRISEMRQRQQDAANRRNEYLDSLDMSRMSNEQQSTLSEYRDLLSQADAIMQGEGNMEDMRDIGRNMMEMRGQVQEILLQQLSLSRGSTDPAKFAADVRQVMQMTGGGFGGGFGGGPGFGGPGRGGPRGGFGGGRRGR